MLLRSSSTPVLGTTLLSPFSDSPSRYSESSNHGNRTIHQPFHNHPTTKITFSHSGHLSVHSSSCNSSPLPHSFGQEPNSSISLRGFRRARSEGNLEGLAVSSFDLEEFRRSNTSSKYFDKTHKAMLETIPSFSIYNSTQGVEGEEGSQQEEIEGEALVLERTVTIGESIRGTASGEFSFGRKTMGLIEEEEEEENVNGFQKVGVEEGVEPVSPPMHLATGPGMDGAGFGGGRVDFVAADFDESGDVEEYYRRMVDADPCNPLFLRNYAQLLQSKGDLQRAEEYYLCATLADPQDGEILMHYAKLIWEVHRDQARALSYFERAAQVASEDSHVLAAYASFLWDIEDEWEDDTAEKRHVEEGLSEFQNLDPEDENKPASPSLHPAAGLGIDVAACGRVGHVDISSINASEISTVEEHYKKMIKENPCNPLFLRNYAQFLFQTKGELQRAEEYYSRAILADPGDGEIMSQYAKLVWELHHDRNKAVSYFERAVQATPGDRRSKTFHGSGQELLRSCMNPLNEPQPFEHIRRHSKRILSMGILQFFQKPGHMWLVSRAYTITWPLAL